MREILQAADWGDVPTWGALTFSVVAILVAFRVYRIEHRRDDRAEADRLARADEERKAQAALVSAWPGYVMDKIAGGFPLRTWGAFVRNASQLPVYDVKIVFWYHAPQSSDREERGSVIRPLVEPSTEPVFTAWPDELRKPSGSDARGNPVFTEALNQFVVSLEFTDTAGRRWRRDVDGSLHEVVARADAASTG